MSNEGFLIGQKGVKYGLTLNPKKVKQQASKLKKKDEASKLKPSTLSAFAQDEDEDEAEASGFRGAAEIAREQAKYSATNARVAAQHAAALAEDPTVFDYDGVIDEIHAGRSEPKQTEKIERKSKYIATLMHHAKNREREQNIIYERQLLKERKQEDHLFGDKDKFVTSAYKKKLQEDAKWLAEEKERERREEEEDVTKRKDLSGMYYNLLKSNSRYAAEATPEDSPQPSSNPEAPPRAGQPPPAPNTSSLSPARHTRSSSPTAPGTSQPQASKPGPSQDSSTPAVGSAPPAASTIKIKEEAEEEGRPGSSRDPEVAKSTLSSSSAPSGSQPKQPATAQSEQEIRQKKEDAVAAARQRYLERKRKVAS